MSLINEALKRASDAQAQAQNPGGNPAPTRPRGPKGVQDLPVPMTPVATAERPGWVPVVGLSLVLVVLLSASGFFFVKWWKERQAWQPYAPENIDEHGMPKTNVVAKLEPPKVTPPKPTKDPVTTVPTPTNPPVTLTNVAVIPPVPPPTLPPEPPKTNPPLVVIVPPPVIPPVPPPPTVIATNPIILSPIPPPIGVPTPPKVEPVAVAVATNAPPPPPPTPPKPAVPTTGEFPELKLQGISRGKKKTFVTINGKTLSLGDRIEGVTLLKIEEDSVTMEKGGAKRELFLLR